MIKKTWLTMALLVCVLGMLSAVPSQADIPTSIVDQYWVWKGLGWENPLSRIGFEMPIWQADLKTLWVDNIYRPVYTKTVWVEIKWVLEQTEPPLLTVIDPTGKEWLPTKSWIDGENTNPAPSSSQYTTSVWQLDWQPEWEYIVFDSTRYHDLNGIEVVEVATKCVPEPMCVVLGVLGLSSVAGFRRLLRK